MRVQPSDGIAYVTLGQSIYPLNGPWKFTIGDSPIDSVTHQPLWAEPTFNDSHWETVDLTPPDGSFDPILGISGYVPGWTAKGHPGYTGYAWYRSLRFVQILSWNNYIFCLIVNESVLYHALFELASPQDDRGHSSAKPTILQLALISLVAECIGDMQ